MTNGNVPHITTAFINGEVVVYDACSENPGYGYYPEDAWEYIGRGTFYTVDGVRQSGKTLKHFYIRRRNKMKNEKITLKEVRDSGMKKWKWLMEHGEIHKVGKVPFFNEINKYLANCSACSMAAEKRGSEDEKRCEVCVLINAIGNCNNEGSTYDKWYEADSAIDRAFYAKKIYEAHVAIKVEEEAPEMQAGDWVRASSGQEGELLFTGSEEGITSPPWGYLRIKGREHSLYTCQVKDLTFISRPEKPVEYVVDNVYFSQKSGVDVPYRNGDFDSQLQNSRLTKILEKHGRKGYTLKIIPSEVKETK